MKLVSGFLLALAFTVPAAELGLDTLPWTDAAYCWSADGARLPQINSNHSGKGPISIGGVKFERGICGHSPFSIVYELDRTADSFSAMIGIDDERHPREREEPTDVWFVVLTDRREVFRRLMKLHQKPEKVEIDLRGRHQMELRGEYGSGFKLQRVAWGNPVIRTGSPEKLRTALKCSRAEHERNLASAPVYPDAPDWKQSKIRKIVWNGFRNAYRIETANYELVIVPEHGGRIMEFRKRGGGSLLKESFVPDQKTRIRGLCPDRGGGHFMRIVPSGKFYPNDPLLEYGKFRIAFPSENEIVMTSSESSLLRTVYEYRLRMQQNELEIVNRLINTAPYERPLAVWSITRLNRRNLSGIQVPPERKNPPEKLKFSHKGNAAVMKCDGNAIIISPISPVKDAYGIAELRCWSESALIRSKDRDGNALTIRYQEPAGDLGGEYPVHVFLNARHVEVESHSPLVPLKSGEAVTLRENWTTE